MGSQRLKHKNLRELTGVPLVTRAIRRCKEANVFDEIWVNSEHEAFSDIAMAEGVLFHRRPQQLGDNQATSEQYIADFLENVSCSYLVQVHSIAPLLMPAEIRAFVRALQESHFDCMLAVENIQIECIFRNLPVNFTFAEKTNSQELEPVKRISWSISAWRRSTFLAAIEGKCATYAGSIVTILSFLVARDQD
jgi:CMP-N-acetylneuraminic acid synthetase